MGWTYTQNCKYRNGKVDRKASCDELYTWENECVAAKVLKSSMVGSVWYGAVEKISKATGERTVFAGICLTQTDAAHGWPFGYKDMDETVDPCEARCPKSTLNLLTKTDNDRALKWRQRCCIENIGKYRVAKSLRELPLHSLIQTQNGQGETVTLEKQQWTGWKRSRWVCLYADFYIPASMIISRGYSIIRCGGAE